MRALYLWLLVSFLATMPASAEPISGTYVGQGSESAFLLQLVETTERQFTGRYEETVLEHGGRIAEVSASITGASDGKTVVVSLKSLEFLPIGMTLSGALEGDQLRLSGVRDGHRINLVLSKSEELAYRLRVENLTAQRQLINQAKARADLLTYISKLVDKMLTYSAEADAQLSKFPPIERRYRAITEVMNAALARQRSIHGDGPAFVARGQISAAIDQAEAEAENMHGSIQSADQEIGKKLQILSKSVADAVEQCRPYHDEQDRDLTDACSKLQDARTKLRAGIVSLAQAFKSAEQIWAEEHPKQQAIAHSSYLAWR